MKYLANSRTPTTHTWGQCLSMWWVSWLILAHIPHARAVVQCYVLCSQILISIDFSRLQLNIIIIIWCQFMISLLYTILYPLISPTILYMHFMSLKVHQDSCIEYCSFLYYSQLVLIMPYNYAASQERPTSVPRNKLEPSIWNEPAGEYQTYQCTH